MILEAIVTTANDDGSANVAPMGPDVRDGFDRFVLRPFRTSTTCRNLLARPEGVLHVTDDALLIAATAVGAPAAPVLQPARAIQGWVVASACRYYEFRVVEVDDRADRVRMVAETVERGVLREFFGFNRARHAVIEAAILATRAEWLPIETVHADFLRHAETVRKTGGDDEFRAIALLSDHVGTVARGRGLVWDDVRP